MLARHASREMVVVRLANYASPLLETEPNHRDDERAWTKKATGPSGDVESENRRECRDANQDVNTL